MKKNCKVLIFGVSVFSVFIGHTVSLRAMEQKEDPKTSPIRFNFSAPSFHLSLEELNRMFSEESIRIASQYSSLITSDFLPKLSLRPLPEETSLSGIVEMEETLDSEREQYVNLIRFQGLYSSKHEWFLIKPSLDYDENDEVVSQTSTTLPSSFIPLYYVRTPQNGDFYLLGTAHNKSGTSISEDIWKIINEKCSYGIQESFTGEEPYYQENGNLLEDEIDNFFQKNSCLLLNEETCKFYQDIHQKLIAKGYYNNALINKTVGKDPFKDLFNFKLALKLIADPKNWSQNVFGHKLQHGEQEFNPLIFTSKLLLHKLEKNPYIKSLFTQNYTHGMDDILHQHFKDKGQPLYGFEGYKDDFLSTSYRKPLEKLATFISSPLDLLTTNEEGKPSSILKLDLPETVLIKLSSLMNNKNFIENELKTSDSIQAKEGKAGHYLYEDPELHHRNQIWANRTSALLDKHPGKTPFIFVGAAHTMGYLSELKVLHGDLEVKHYHEGSWQPFTWDKIRRFSQGDDSEGK